MEQGWERSPRLRLSLDELSHLVEPAFPGRKIAEHAMLAAGLANTNVRFRMHGEEESHVLRLHTRDPSAAHRERDLMRYLSRERRRSIPVAPLLYSDPQPKRGNHPYSIWGFVEGTLLQELFPNLPADESDEVAASCGRVLASIASHRFPWCGEFGPDLEIVREYGLPSRFVPETVHQALFEGRAGQRLGEKLRDELWKTVERTSPTLQEIDGRYTLVHADYKRSNILMKRVGKAWRVAAVLDWEFACAGPPLIDVGLFLRAGKRLPAGFRGSFASAYQDGGGQLPSDWLPLSRLVDVVSQVTFLNDPHDRPKVFAETVEMVKETIRMLV